MKAILLTLTILLTSCANMVHTFHKQFDNEKQKEKDNRKFKFLNFMYKIKKGHCISESEPLFPRYD